MVRDRPKVGTHLNLPIKTSFILTFSVFRPDLRRAHLDGVAQDSLRPLPRAHRAQDARRRPRALHRAAGEGEEGGRQRFHDAMKLPISRFIAEVRILAPQNSPLLFQTGVKSGSITAQIISGFPAFPLGLTSILVLIIHIKLKKKYKYFMYTYLYYICWLRMPLHMTLPFCSPSDEP